MFTCWISGKCLVLSCPTHSHTSYSATMMQGLIRLRMKHVHSLFHVVWIKNKHRVSEDRFNVWSWKITRCKLILTPQAEGSVTNNECVCRNAKEPIFKVLYVDPCCRMWSSEFGSRVEASYAPVTLPVLWQLLVIRFSTWSVVYMLLARLAPVTREWMVLRWSSVNCKHQGEAHY